MDKKKLSPVVIFTYNRLDHTRKNIEHLKKNKLASQTDLYIYSNAPSKKEDRIKVEELRKYLKTIEGFKSVKVIEREKPLELSTNIRLGVSEIIKKYKKVIVLEDDVITAHNFLSYMNNALDFYENEENIFTITGWRVPMDTKVFENYKYDTFLVPRATAYAWGIWEDRWELIDWDKQNYKEDLKDKRFLKKFERAGEDLPIILENHSEAWDITVCYTQNKLEKYTVYPIKSKIENTGMDGSGTHSFDDETKYILDDFDKNDRTEEFKFYMGSLNIELLKAYNVFYKLSFKSKIVKILKKWHLYFLVEVLKGKLNEKR